jgi:hypothetical protein
MPFLVHFTCRARRLEYVYSTFDPNVSTTMDQSARKNGCTGQLS